MLRKVRAQLSYANVMASIAVFIALGGGAYAAVIAPKNSVTSRSIKNGQVKRQDLARGAVSNTRLGRNAVSNSKIGPNAVNTAKLADGSITPPKLLDAAVTNSKLADGSVTTPKLADNAVTSSKLAPNSVSGLSQITDGTVTGADILENTLNFGCSALAVQSPNQGPYQISNTGFCAFVIHPAAARKWAEAANDCSGIVPDATLANPAEIAQVVASTGSQGPLLGTSGIWTPDPAGASPSTSVWTVAVSNTGDETFTSAPIGTGLLTPIVCVYQPASKNG